MKATSVTFRGSLGELVSTLREAARTRNRWEVIKIFPETGRNRSITGDIDSLGEYCKNPARRMDLLKKGRVRMIIPFFDKKMSDLEKFYFALYSESQEDIGEAKRSFRKLNSNLREIRRRVHVSRSTENVFCQEDFVLAVKDFNTSLPPSFTRWQITAANFGLQRHPPSKPVRIIGHSRPIRLRPAPREWEFTFPPTVKEIDKLINFAGTWARRLRNRPKTGRPPKPFNALLFYVVNAFIERVIVWKRVDDDGRGEWRPIVRMRSLGASNVIRPPRHANDWKRGYIERDGKFRIRKNWQLVCAALLWLHVLYDIHEMRAFIQDHKDEEAGVALRKFVSWAKREYSHFRESGKGRGKFGPAFADGSERLNIPLVYLREDGSLSGWLV
jgi:hypothetical protein